MGSCYSKGQKMEISKYTHQRRESNQTPSFGWESEDEVELPPTCQVSKDKPEPPASSSRAVFDEEQLQIKQERAADTSHSHLSAEELLRYHQALQEERNRVVALESQLPVGGATGQQQQEVKAKETTDRGTQTEKINAPVETRSRCVAQTQTTGGVGAPWTSKELLDLVQNAPDPLTKPMDLYRWLRQACLVYEPRPVQVRMFLQMVFESQWQKVEKNFHVPGSDTDADWSGVDAMTTWLDINFKKSVLSEAWRNSNGNFSFLCHQKPNESMADFLPRFQQMMKSCYDEDYYSCAVFNLKMCLQPHVAELFELKAANWSSYTFQKAAAVLNWLEDRGMLESKEKTLAIGEKLRSGEEEEEEKEEELNAPPSYPHGKRRGECFSCGRLGHWARECRASFPIQPKQRASEWTYID